MAGAMAQNVILLKKEGGTWEEFYQALCGQIPPSWTAQSKADGLFLLPNGADFYYLLHCSSDTGIIQVRTDDAAYAETLKKNIGFCNRLLDDFITDILAPCGAKVGQAYSLSGQHCS